MTIENDSKESRHPSDKESDKRLYEVGDFIGPNKIKAITFKRKNFIIYIDGNDNICWSGADLSDNEKSYTSEFSRLMR